MPVYPTAACLVSRGWIEDVHAGIDIACQCGTPVVAWDDGTVRFVAYEADGYGQWVGISHADGVETRYAHLSQQIASVGAPVFAGEVVGLVGTTGRSTGCHLHFEVLIGGMKVDPYPFLVGLGPVVEPGEGAPRPQLPEAPDQCRSLFF